MLMTLIVKHHYHVENNAQKVYFIYVFDKAITISSLVKDIFTSYP